MAVVGKEAMMEALCVSKTGVDVFVSSHYICTFVITTGQWGRTGKRSMFKSIPYKKLMLMKVVVSGRWHIYHSTDDKIWR